eukprot:7174025-Ditylum_brightwellii.AAC.1
MEKLQHASYKIPGGTRLFSPLQMAMKGSPEYIRLIPWIREALIDWTFLVKYLKAHPTSVRQLVRDYPSYLGYTDACLLGVVECGRQGQTTFNHWCDRLSGPWRSKHKSTPHQTLKATSTSMTWNWQA